MRIIGISAISLPDTPSRSEALAATYLVVLFAVVVQGATIERTLVRDENFG